ncbi:CHAD domain-containing protein [Methyloprofundus sedimenti]|uniref:CHAD domain-containing protein n=1 Tax=Methyloprofundus sedimenti TaxID=1420851 RepID=UPI00117C552B|nr:CHAD domain-containing protein [Methyloprofundus sedimenti]
MPHFCDQFRDGRLKTQLSPLLEMRALLPLSQLPHQVHRINVLNQDKKTVLRIRLDEYESLPNRISLQRLKGYEKAAEKVSLLLQQALQLKTTTPCSILDHALKLQSRKALDYSSKLSIKLDPKMRADQASVIIFQQLLRTMQINESNTIADVDSEFLHDFRVAIRRTRAGLSQIKHALPSSVVARYAVFFAWLGQITGQTRDMDVYLLSYKQYKAALPVSLREDITPLYAFLKEKKGQAQKDLAEKLSSSTYRKELANWEQYLKEPLEKKDKGENATLSIKELADQRIWKVFKRVIKEGESINKSSPAEELHELRKTCKKLRYLMEFFESLYPKDKMKILIKSLKGLQSVLGDFQDYEVQETNIKHFSEEMMANNVPPNTFLAMGVLVQYLDSIRCAARNDFARQFALFEKAENQSTFKYLFAHKA